jgi:hypothetical protein
MQYGLLGYRKGDIHGRAKTSQETNKPTSVETKIEQFHRSVKKCH